MSAQRTTFKFFASFGPAGSVAVFAEWIAQSLWYEAYEQGDSTLEPAEKYVTMAQEQRSAYVSDLFKVKGKLNREMVSFKPEVKEAAYKELATIIEKHSKIISRTEKNRLLRERIMLRNNQAEYNRRIKAARYVSADTDDNLIKMALKIITECKKDELLKYVTAEEGEGAVDVEEGNIETRVTRQRADQLLEAWKKILIQHENEGNNIETILAGSNSLIGDTTK